MIFSLARMQLKSCCCAFSLRTGTLFAGISSIILSIVMIILIWAVPKLEIKMMVIVELSRLVVNIILTINLIMTIIISSLLIYGGSKKKTVLMLPWIILGAILLVSALISVLYTGIKLIIENKEHTSARLTGILVLIIGPIILAIYTYFWLVAFSYFQQLRKDKNSGKIGPYGRPYNYRRA